MGIAGLLPQLRSITKKAHVSRYRGQTVAVDAYCLLHRGAYTCPRELVEGEPTDRHVHYCMSRIDLLTGAGVTPLVVFDGGRLPNKLDEERTRERNREENKARARSLWQQGNRAAAMECYQRAVDISPAHAKQFVEALKRRNIQFIVAPYEADAQMAYLALNGLVDAVLTEDSDLLCYGCPTVFFKMDKLGEGEEVQLRDLPLAKELAFQGFGHDLFQEMCVLAGCDFVGSLPGIGIKKAHQHLRRTRCFLKVVRSLRFDGTKIPEGYERRVQRALWTFKHQRVYCPCRRAAVHLHEIVGGDLAAGARVPAAAQLVDDEPDFLGPALPDDMAQAIAEGDLDPISKEPFGEDLRPSTAPLAADAAVYGGSQVAAGPFAALRQPLSGQQQDRSGRCRSGQQQQQPGAGNGGNTLTNYFKRSGALKGLSTSAAAAEFRPPRESSSRPGSQESADGQQEQHHEVPPAETAAAVAAVAQQRQQDEGEGEVPQCSSPRAATQVARAGGDTLASPTQEQWQRFKALRHKSSGRAALAAGRQAGAGPTTSSYFVKPAAVGMRKPSVAPQGGTLLAKLKAALQPDEPTVEELLSSRKCSPPPSAEIVEDAEEAPDSDSEEEQQQQRRRHGQPRGGRCCFSVPHARQLPTTPHDLGLRSSPTIDDLLDGQAAASAGRQEQDACYDLLGDSILVEQPRASLRAWLPPPPQQQQQQQPEAPPQLDLVSPLGFALQSRGQQQQAGDEGGITPGFYLGGGGSEAGSGARLASLPCSLPQSLPRRLPAATPCSSSPPRSRLHQAAAPRLTGAPGSAAGGLERSFDAAVPLMPPAAVRVSAAAAAMAAADSEEPGPSPASDPIASLTHIAAFQLEAEAAVERAAQAAMASAAQQEFRPLPPPPHLQDGGSAGHEPLLAAVGSRPAGSQTAHAICAAAKRPLLEAVGRLGAAAKENRQGPMVDSSSKRQKGDLTTNLFAGFAMLGKQ